MSAGTCELFVYGTLMPGGRYHRQIAQHVRDVRAGVIEGMLIDLGAYPALVPGTGAVRGVLLTIDAAALPIADQIEGYHVSGGESLFVRKPVIVRLDAGGVIEAWGYEFARPGRIAHRRRACVGREDGAALYAWPPGA
jgi:gamma-glutamylcyclotransferase (GGCT)/AIG2-like uncharacterized protein YtfP